VGTPVLDHQEFATVYHYEYCDHERERTSR